MKFEVQTKCSDTNDRSSAKVDVPRIICNEERALNTKFDKS